MGDLENCRRVNLKTVSGKNAEMKLWNWIIKHLEDHIIRMAKPVQFMTMENLLNFLECINKGEGKRKSVDIMYLVF